MLSSLRSYYDSSTLDLSYKAGLLILLALEPWIWTHLRRERQSLAHCSYSKMMLVEFEVVVLGLA